MEGIVEEWAVVAIEKHVGELAIAGTTGFVLGVNTDAKGDEAVQIDVYTKFLLDFAHAIQRFFVRFQVPGGRHVKKVGETQLERGAELDEDARSAAELGDEPTVEGLVPEPLGMDGGAVRLTDLNVVGVKRLDDFHVIPQMKRGVPISPYVTQGITQMLRKGGIGLKGGIKIA